MPIQAEQGKPISSKAIQCTEKQRIAQPSYAEQSIAQRSTECKLIECTATHAKISRTQQYSALQDLAEQCKTKKRRAKQCK